MSYPTREMLQNMSDNTAKRKKNQNTKKFYTEYAKFKDNIDLARKNLTYFAFKNSQKEKRINSVGHFNCKSLKEFVNYYNKKENDTGLDLIFKEVNCSVHWNWE